MKQRVVVSIALATLSLLIGGHLQAQQSGNSLTVEGWGRLYQPL